MVKFLVEQGASVGAANDKGYIPLDLATFGEKMEVVDYFLAGMGDLEGENGEGLGSAAHGLELGETEAEVDAEGAATEEAEEAEKSGNKASSSA